MELYNFLMGSSYLSKDAVYRPIQAVNPEYPGQIVAEVYILETGLPWPEFERVLLGLENLCMKDNKFRIVSDTDLVHIPPESPLGTIIQQHKATEKKSI